MKSTQKLKSDTDFLVDDDEVSKIVLIAPNKWKILIVDDEQGVHDITKLALAKFEFEGKELEFLHAYSAAEAKQQLKTHRDIAVALVDVVMENEHAGLDLVRDIRNMLCNNLIRIILRTGQPGQAPERLVIRNFDINDYKDKAELTAQKLYSSVLTSLRSYRDMLALDSNRRGLEQVIESSATLFQIQGITGFIQGVLEQLIALLYLDHSSMYINCDGIALENVAEKLSIIAATGRYSKLIGKEVAGNLPKNVVAAIEQALSQKKSLTINNVYVAYFRPRLGREDVIYISSSKPISADDSNLIQLFLHNVSIAYENALLREEIEGTQRDIVYMLGEAIETRSRETGQHVRRVAEYCYLIAKGINLTDRQAEILKIAAPLHDFGKVGIPDAILHQTGKLKGNDWEIMKTHAVIGQEMLAKSNREILKAASILAGQHHEKWDGSGYPDGLAGEDIHIFGRIGAVADVFDALGSKRCYKKAWPIETIIDYLKRQRSIQFDPMIVDWVLANMDQMVNVRDTYPDAIMEYNFLEIYKKNQQKSAME
jgi:response regulator RpfG family c-di-GMP phosphodiesterase